jgi:Xaa-Pro aminopeptidase
MNQRLQSSIEALRASGADWAIVSRPDSILYVTGHIVPVEAGPSPFAGGPTLGILGADGTVGLVAANVEAGSAAASWADEVALYEGFAFAEPTDVQGNYQRSVSAVANKLGLGGKVAIEPGAFPQLLRPLLDGREVVDFSPALMRVRAVKGEEELALMRHSAEAAAIGQRTFLQILRPGRTELEVFAEIRCAIESFAGERVPITGDFLSGRERTAGFTGWPNTRRIENGDPVMADLAPRVAGYWGDSCATATAGDPSPGFLKLFEAAKTALDLAVEIMRPGLAISELDRQLRAHVGRYGYAYPHHSGHSLGTAVHEWPRIVPYETATLQAGMVLMVEPGAYDPEIGGVRTEWMIEVTVDGCRRLTDFEHVPAVISAP